MTVAAIASIVTYNENGSSTVFAVPFQFIAPTDLVVERTDPAGAVTLLVMGTDYSVSGGGGGASVATGSITTAAPRPTGWTIGISRATPMTQPANYTPGDTFPAEMHERALDRGMLVSQELAEGLIEEEAALETLLARALRVPVPETIADLPFAPSRAMKLFGFDAGGQPRMVDGGAFKGDPGGNAMAVGLFTVLSTLMIPIGTDLIQTSGWGTIGKGAGLYIADPLVDAAFVAANPAWSAITANGRGFRLLDVQTLWVEMFGAAGDATGAVIGTDDDPAFIAAKAFQNNYRFFPSGNSDYKPVPTVWLRAVGYRSAGGARTAWEFKNCAHDFRSVGSNFQGNNGAWIWVDAGNPGCVIQCWDTEGLTYSGTHVHHPGGTDPRGAQGAVLQDITFYSRGGTLGADDQNGIVIHTSCQLTRTFAMNFGGHGIALVADVTNGSNASDTGIFWCGGIRNGLSGWCDSGGDVNASQILGFQAYSNGHWGIEARGFLGNFYQWFLTDGNGRNAGPSWAPIRSFSSVTLTGFHYRVIPGQDAGASANPPTGTSASNSWWYCEGPGTPSSIYPTYSPTQAYAAGGAFLAQDGNARNVFAGYQEGDQNGGWSNSGTSVCMPGFAAFANRGATNMGIAGGVICTAVGMRNAGATAGNVVTAMFSSGNTNAGPNNTFFYAGNSNTSATPWAFAIDENQVISASFLGGGGIFVLRPTTDAARTTIETYLAVKTGTVKLYGAPAQPTTLAWTLGDLVWNSTVDINGDQPLAWRCIAAGTPGSWEALFGATTKPGVTTVGNTDKTITGGTDRGTQIWGSPLTADRTATLVGNVQGQTFRVVRTATATGAFSLNVGSPALKVLATAGSWADVEYNGASWFLTAAGSL